MKIFCQKQLLSFLLLTLQQEVINNIINGGYTKASLPEELKSAYMDICNYINKKCCKGVVLACTELPLLFDNECYGDMIVIDSNSVLAENTVEMAQAKSLCSITPKFS